MTTILLKCDDTPDGNPIRVDVRLPYPSLAFSLAVKGFGGLLGDYFAAILKGAPTVCRIDIRPEEDVVIATLVEVDEARHPELTTACVGARMQEAATRVIDKAGP